MKNNPMQPNRRGWVWVPIILLALLIAPVCLIVWLACLILQRLHITAIARSFDSITATALTFVAYCIAMVGALYGLLQLTTWIECASENTVRYILFLGTLSVASILCWAAPQIYCFIWILMGNGNTAPEEQVKQDFGRLWKLLHLIAVLLIKPLSLTGEAELLADVLLFVFLAIPLVQTVLPAKQEQQSPA